MAADHAREDSDIARATAKQFAPDFQQPGNSPHVWPGISPSQSVAAKCTPSKGDA